MAKRSLCLPLMITPFFGIVDAGIDVILVGDSASNVIAGHETTLPITLDQMIYHLTLLFVQLEELWLWSIFLLELIKPILKRLKSAIKIMKESGGHAVKLEGGIQEKQSIERILQVWDSCHGSFGLNPTIHL